jgi:hypothetical protein
LREASRAPKASARTKAVLRQRTLGRGCKIPCGISAFSIDAHDRHLPKRRVQYVITGKAFLKPPRLRG